MTPLLDTTALSFLHPPRNTPLAVYASPVSPLLSHRVCDMCHDQIHGIPPKPLPIPEVALEAPQLAKTNSRRRRSRMASYHAPPLVPVEVELPPDLAELATYPLRHPSAICKATGGGRWVPTPSPIDPALRRVPGKKAGYEIMLEQEEMEARRKHENPLITHGEFQMRKPVDHRALRLAEAARSA